MTPRAAAAIAVLAGVSALTVPAAAATRSVRVGSYYFEDATRGDGRVVVQQGDRITFAFEGKAQHTATVDGLFSSGTKSPGQRYTTPLLTKVGTFTLYCQVHGAPRHGTALVVQRRPSPAASATAGRRTPPPPSPSPRPASPTASPSRSPSPSPSPTASPSPTPSPRRTPSPAASSTAGATPSATPSQDVAAGNAPDVLPAGPLDDSGPGWLLPAAVLLLLVLLGAGAISLGRRRRL